jgi:hypothetical protein
MMMSMLVHLRDPARPVANLPPAPDEVCVPAQTACAGRSQTATSMSVACRHRFADYSDWQVTRSSQK